MFASYCFFLRLLCDYSLFYSVLSRKGNTLFSAIKTKLSYFLGMAILNPLVFYLLLFSAYGRLPAATQTINYTWAITLGLLSVPLLRQRLLKVDFLAMFLGYFGVVIVPLKAMYCH